MSPFARVLGPHSASTTTTTTTTPIPTYEQPSQMSPTEAVVTNSQGVSLASTPSITPSLDPVPQRSGSVPTPMSLMADVHHHDENDHLREEQNEPRKPENSPTPVSEIGGGVEQSEPVATDQEDTTDASAPVFLYCLSLLCMYLHLTLFVTMRARTMWPSCKRKSIN